MSYGGFFKVILILTAILTICIGILKPKMHTSVMIQNSEYATALPDIKTTDNTQLMPTVSTEQAKNTVTKDNNITISKENTKKVDNTVKKTVNTKPISNTTVATNVVTQKTVVKETKPVVKNTQTTVKPVTNSVKILYMVHIKKI